VSVGAYALIGVGVGAVLGFASAQLTGTLLRRRRGRAAARLVWTELSRSEALAENVGKFGLETPPPILPRFAFWEAHAASLADVVHPDVLMDLEVAYGWVEILRNLVTAEERHGTNSEFQEFVARIHAGIGEGKTAVEPYARRRSLPWHRSAPPEIVAS
jgi:hypothetical protein